MTLKSNADVRLIIFTKAPVAGHVKTRLTPYLTEEQAALCYKKMLLNTLDIVKQAKGIDVECWFASEEDAEHEVAKDINREYGFTIGVQQGESLGDRMLHGLKSSLVSYQHVIIIGCDCPVISLSYINEAVQCLVGSADTVLGPAEDGGYVLVGANSYHDDMFKNVVWGESEVLSKTINNFQQCQLSVMQLNTLWDVDYPEDFHRWKNLVVE